MNEFIHMFNSMAPEHVSTSVKLLLLLTVLSVAPGILIMMTCFTRIVIVLSFVRTSLGTQQMPPNQVLIGLALFLTFFIMAPTWKDIHDQALEPLFAEKIDLDEAYERAAVPLKQFMSQHTRQQDLALFLSYSGAEPPKTVNDIPLTALVPAFAISELKTAVPFFFSRSSHSFRLSAICFISSANSAENEGDGLPSVFVLAAQCPRSRKPNRLKSAIRSSRS